MSDFDEDGRRIPDDDERYDAMMERRQRAWATRCQCRGIGVGWCPGPANCPYASPLEDEDDV